jgi:hypothetical protein
VTTAQIEQRLRALEKKVNQLRSAVIRRADPSSRWWEFNAGRFANDPIFDEIVRLGGEYRDSLRPVRKKRKS